MKYLKFEHFLPGIIGIIMTVLGGIAIMTYSFVFAAPTQAPPDGNPTFPLTGPPGADGADGTIGDVRAVVLECNGRCYDTMPTPQQICQARFGSTYKAIGYSCECIEEPTIGGTTYINKSMTQAMPCCDTSGEDAVVTCGAQ